MGTNDAKSTNEPTVERVTDALRSVLYPGLGRDLVSFGMVEHVSVSDGRVTIRLGIRTRDTSMPQKLEASITDALRPLGVLSLALEIGEPAAAPRPAGGGTPDPWSDQVRLATVRHVIAVGAGKGGVGKSTVAMNLALALKRQGVRTGLLDADIYGPSLPILLGMEHHTKDVKISADKHILPLETHGMPMMSFAYFLGEGSPAIWRGPMVSKAVKQFVRGVAWPELDVLIVDLPPGTGDIPLSLAQSVVLSGAVIVTQPPRVAVAEARKAAEMFKTLEVPLLGIVENMTGPFGSGAGRAVAAELGIAFLGEIPFDDAIVSEGDAGTPTMIARPESASGIAFDQVATAIAGVLGWQKISDVN